MRRTARTSIGDKASARLFMMTRGDVSGRWANSVEIGSSSDASRSDSEGGTSGTDQANEAAENWCSASTCDSDYPSRRSKHEDGDINNQKGMSIRYPPVSSAIQMPGPDTGSGP